MPDIKPSQLAALDPRARDVRHRGPIRLIHEAEFKLESDVPALLPYQTFLFFRRVEAGQR